MAKKSAEASMQQRIVDLVNELRSGYHGQAFWAVLFDRLLEIPGFQDQLERLQPISVEQAWNRLEKAYREDVTSAAQNIRDEATDAWDEDELRRRIDDAVDRSLTYNRDVLLTLLATRNDNEIFDQGLELDIGDNAQHIYSQIAYWAFQRDLTDEIDDLAELIGEEEIEEDDDDGEDDDDADDEDDEDAE